jgi:hypothetical protein
MTRSVSFRSIISAMGIACRKSQHRRMIRLLVLFITAGWLGSAAEVQTVIIFAVDGLGANVLRAKMPPNFREFQRESLLVGSSGRDAHGDVSEFRFDDQRRRSGTARGNFK